MSAIEEALAAAVLELTETVRALRAELAEFRAESGGKERKRQRDRERYSARKTAENGGNVAKSSENTANSTVETAVLGRGVRGESCFAALSPLPPPSVPETTKSEISEIPRGIPGRSHIWKQWDEAAVLARKFKSGEGERFQDLLDNIRLSGHTDAEQAFDVLCSLSITSKAPGMLVMTMIGHAADGVSYHTLACDVLLSQESGRALALVLNDRMKVPNPFALPEIPLRIDPASDDRDWRKAMQTPQ